MTMTIRHAAMAPSDLAVSLEAAPASSPTFARAIVDSIHCLYALEDLGN